MIASRPCWTLPRCEPRLGLLEGAGATSDRELDLYAQWERSAGRSVYGLAGKYRIIHQGKRNGGPGPDFLGAAMVFPDGTVRRGDVEIHLRREGWRQHRHRWDPCYRQVILHVIAAGTLEAVPQERWRVVPTVSLPREPVSFQPLCEAIPRALSGFRAQADFLRTLAMQRWWRRLADLNGRESRNVLDALARRLGPDHHRLALVKLWLAPGPGEEDLFSFVSGMMARLPLEATGRIRKELPGRLVFLSALAHTYNRTPSSLWAWALEEARQLVQQLREGGLPIPTRPFLIESVGNWLLPLSSANTGADRFDEWYRLPLGWTYGRVRRHVERLGLQRPANFGQQQGLLEWIESLCQPAECACCPAAEAAGDF